MRSDRFTEKAQEALQEAAELARSNGQQAVEPEHLLLALIEQHGGVARTLLEGAGVQLRRLERRLAERRVGLVVTDEARQLLAKRGWDPVYGARPLKRAIQRLVQDPLAMMLLEARFAEGDTVEVGVSGGELSFVKAKTAAPVG
ncbi:hypothetical protein EPN29_09965 [bacterium]|nr:MAG: hypothetical protein EPN29_09965 [bacterium]